jgi:hypothetical protein
MTTNEDHVWCRCVPDKNRGWSLDYVRGVWVCSMCHEPSKATRLAMSDPHDRIEA